MSRACGPLRIGIAPPLWAPIPPKTYGGVELMVHLLTGELVRQGHQVTLFGTGDSRTPARLEAVCEQNILDFMAGTEACVYEAFANAAVARTLARAEELDVIHFHSGMHWLPFATLVKTPCLFTIHTFASFDDRWIARNFPTVPLNGISQCQAAQIAGESGREIPVVYNGCDFSAFQPRYEPGRYLAFLGRMSYDKNPLDAIRLAQAAGMPIVLAGQAQQAKEEAYFEKEIRPLIDGERVRYIGPVNHAQKQELLRNAAALIFPIQWEEPFGLVMIEAMACGTPVLGHALGSVAEVVDAGITGFYAPEIAQMGALVPEVLALDRRRVRQQAESRFSCQRMVSEYVDLYRRI
ncbi:MAG TPA: glycosyltransferase family 4 protein [Chthoniobacteraceae bacterium]|nr:glycosyltransferase family 4 protein [Chthoniobacteraceae bacterium]